MDALFGCAVLAVLLILVAIYWAGANHHEAAVKRALLEKGYGPAEVELALGYKNRPQGLLFIAALPDRNAVALGRLGAKVDERKSQTGAVRLCQNCRSAEVDASGVCPLCKK